VYAGNGTADNAYSLIRLPDKIGSLVGLDTRCGVVFVYRVGSAWGV